MIRVLASLAGLSAFLFSVSCATGARGPAAAGACDPNHFESDFLNELELAMRDKYGADVAARCTSTTTLTTPAALGKTAFKGHLKDSKSAYRKEKTEVVYQDREDAGECASRRAEACPAATAAWKHRWAAR